MPPAPPRPRRRSKRCRRGRRRLRQRRQALRPARAGEPATPIAREIVAVEAGQHGDARRPSCPAARRPWPLPASPGRPRHGRSGCGLQRRKRLDGLGDGVRNVVQLEVEEDREARARARGARRRGRCAQKNSRPSFTPPASPRTALGDARARGRGRAYRSRRRSDSYDRRLRPDRGVSAGVTVACCRSSAVEAPPVRPDARAHDQPGREEAEQEDDKQQDRKL